jgi:hypothetical protein
MLCVILHKYGVRADLVTSVTTRSRRNYLSPPTQEGESKNITFGHGVGEIAFVASIMFGGWADIPAEFAVFTKSGATF